MPHNENADLVLFFFPERNASRGAEAQRHGRARSVLLLQTGGEGWKEQKNHRVHTGPQPKASLLLKGQRGGPVVEGSHPDSESLDVLAR